MNFYLKCIEHEVYGDKKLNLVSRFKIRTFNPALNAVYLLRKYQFYIEKNGFFNNIMAKMFYKKLTQRYNIYLRKTTKIGMGLKLPHPTGIVFGEWTVLGENCWVYQHVTFGSKTNELTGKGLQPIVEDNCRFYAGACVIGPVTIRKGTIVGCNSVISQNTEDNSIYVGVNKKLREVEKIEYKECNI